MDQERRSDTRNHFDRELEEFSQEFNEVVLDQVGVSSLKLKLDLETGFPSL